MKLFDKKLNIKPAQEKEPFFLGDEPPTAEIQYQLLADWKSKPVNADNLDALLKEWFIAIKQNDLRKFIQGIQAHLPLTAIHDKGYTLLSYALKNGKLGIATLLMRRPHQLNPAFTDLENNVRYSAFHCACLSGRFDLVEILLDDFNKQNRFSINTHETKHKKSPLQLVVGEHHFECAEKMIEKYEPELSHADYRGRTVLSTLLGCYVDEGFDQLSKNPKKLEQLQNLTLTILKNEDAFTKKHETAQPAFLQFRTCELALDLPSGTELNKRISTVDLIITIMVHAPRLAKALLAQAQKNPAGEHQELYCKSYMEAERHLKPDSLALLRQAQ